MNKSTIDMRALAFGGLIAMAHLYADPFLP